MSIGAFVMILVAKETKSVLMVFDANGMDRDARRFNSITWKKKQDSLLEKNTTIAHKQSGLKHKWIPLQVLKNNTFMNLP